MDRPPDPKTSDSDNDYGVVDGVQLLDPTGGPDGPDPDLVDTAARDPDFSEYKAPS